MNESQSTVSDSQSTVNESQSTVNESSATKSCDDCILMWQEYVLCGCFIARLLGLVYGAVLVYSWKRRRIYKLSDVKEKQMIIGVLYNRDLTDGVSSWSTSSSVVILHSSDYLSDPYDSLTRVGNC